MKSKVMPSLVLGSICLVVALLLSVVNMFTAPIIAKNQADKANGALAEIYPGGSGFKEIDISTYALPESITAAYSEASGGFVIQSTVTGYKPGMIIMCGIDKDGKIVGADYIQSNETLSAEIGLGDRFVGKEQSELTPDIVAGSTSKLTTGAYYQAIIDSLNAFTILNGGSVDLRSPEDIKCNEALGTETLTFTKWFAVEALDDVSTVYVSDDETARVYVVGETYIGIFADGTVATTTASTEDQEKALAADAAVKASNITDVTNLLGGAIANVTKVEKTDSGNYIFEIDGYGYKYQKFASEKNKIKIKVSISAEGKILDVVTLSQEESTGIGDVCATEDYYKVWIGAENSDIVISADRTSPSFDITDYEMDIIDDNCTDIGVITGATFTTVGYQEAVKLAFTTFEALTTEGGNQ